MCLPTAKKEACEPCPRALTTVDEHRWPAVWGVQEKRMIRALSCGLAHD